MATGQARALQRHLRLRHQRDQLAVLGFDPGLPDLRPPAAVNKRRAADEDRADRGAGEEVRLALERRRALGFGSQTDEGGRAAERVGQAHDRPAMGEAAERAEFRLNQHARLDGVRPGARELDAEQFGERQRMCFNVFQGRHEARLRNSNDVGIEQSLHARGAPGKEGRTVCSARVCSRARKSW